MHGWPEFHYLFHFLNALRMTITVSKAFHAYCPGCKCTHGAIFLGPFFMCADLLIGVLYKWLAGSLSVKLTWFRNIPVPLSSMSGK